MAPPVLTFSNDPSNQNPQMHALVQHSNQYSPLANFLCDFRPALLSNYQQKGILVFSTHWETEGEHLGGLLLFDIEHTGKGCAHFEI